jgi:hypothetical protein
MFSYKNYKKVFLKMSDHLANCPPIDYYFFKFDVYDTEIGRCVSAIVLVVRSSTKNRVKTDEFESHLNRVIDNKHLCYTEFLL